MSANTLFYPSNSNAVSAPSQWLGQMCRFVKRGFLYTSNSGRPCIAWLSKDTWDWNFLQPLSFLLTEFLVKYSFYQSEVKHHQSWQIGCVWKIPFCKHCHEWRFHYYSLYSNNYCVYTCYIVQVWDQPYCDVYLNVLINFLTLCQNN